LSKVTITVNVFNNTNGDMILEDACLEHGKWLDRPENIERGGRGHFEAGNGKECSIRGQVNWSIRSRNDFSISFYKPLNGITNFRVDCPNNFRYVISGDTQERNAQVDVTFFNQDFE
jgi:hypothetical protein